MRNVRRFLAAWRSSSQGDQPGHRCVSSLLRLLLLLPLLALAGTAAPGAADLASHSQDQIRALQEEKGRRTPAQRKLDSQLLIACRQHRGELMAPGVTHLRPGIRHRQADRVLVDIQAEVSPELLALLRRAGGSVVNSFPQHQAIRAWLPLGAVESVAEWAQVRNVRPAAEAATNVGSVTSEGDLTHQAGLGRPSYAVDG